MQEGPLRKIHILVTARHPVGGIRTFMRYVYKRFDKRLFRFTFIVPDNSELKALQQDLTDIGPDWNILPDNYPVKDFIFWFQRHLKQAHVIHAHGYTALIYSVLQSKLYGKPVILTSHDVFNENQFTGTTGRIKKHILGLCFQFVNQIHSVSNDAQDNMTAFFPWLTNKQDKLVIVPNGIEIERFFIEDGIEWRQELKLEKNTFLIGFFGRFMSQKGFKFLIEAVEILSHKQDEVEGKPLVLAFGWGGFIREEQAVIKEKGLSKYFRFMPFQDNPARAMRGLDVIVMPSLWEACPLQPMEAMVAGVPIIGTDCIGLREVLKDTPARVIPKGDSKALADAILEEMQAPSKREMELFREEAARRFNVEKQARAIEKLIKEAAQKTR